MSYVLGKIVICKLNPEFDHPTAAESEFKIIDKFEGKYPFYVLMHSSGKLKYQYLDTFTRDYRFKDLNYDDI